MSILPAKIGAIKPMTRKILDYLVQYKLEHDGNSPSLMEIGRAMHMSSDKAVRYHLDKLEEMGLICRLPGERRLVVNGASWRPPAHLLVDHVVAHPKQEATLAREERCKTCGKPDPVKDGYCNTCYAFRNRTGRSRPAHLYKHEAPYGWCLCGNGATVAVMTAVGEIPLCVDCARAELEDA